MCWQESEVGHRSAQIQGISEVRVGKMMASAVRRSDTGERSQLVEGATGPCFATAQGRAEAVTIFVW